MKQHRYPVKIYDAARRFEFNSNGPKGRIHKQVVFSELENYPGLYNLAFGDVTLEGVDHSVVTDNRDSQLVLSTVGYSIRIFLSKYSSNGVFIRGGTGSRNRLYRMVINKLWPEIKDEFVVLGLKGNQWYPFGKGIGYEGFFIEKKLTLKS